MNKIVYIGTFKSCNSIFNLTFSFLMESLRINYLAVMASVAAIYFLASIWCTIFDRPYSELTGVTQAMSAKVGMSPLMMSIINYLLGAFSMGIIFKSAKINTATIGALTGLLLGFLLVGSNIFTNNPSNPDYTHLTMLNILFKIVSCIIMGAILGGWTKYSQ